MTYPLWGNEESAVAIAGKIADDGCAVVDIVGAEGAPTDRLARDVAARLVHDGHDIIVIEAGNAAALDETPACDAVFLLSAHDADTLAIGRVLRRVLDATSVIFARTGDADDARFSGLQRIGNRMGEFARLEVAAPTVDAIAESLSVERSAAEALYRAAGGADDALVDLLDDLNETSGPTDLAGFLSGLASDAAPSAGLGSVQKQVLELVAVTRGPLSVDVIARASGLDGRDILDAVDQLSSAELVADDADGLALGRSTAARNFARTLSASRVAAAHRTLADDASAPDRAWHYAQAGSAQAAFDLYAEQTGSSSVDAALDMLEAGATTDARTHGRLLLSRAISLRFAGHSDQALDDLNEAVGLLTGAERIDALGFLATVLDDQQLPQQADVAVARAEWEAARQGFLDKLGSLLSLRARLASRLGFAAEADHALDTADGLVAEHGSDRQRRNLRTNRAWIAFDRGEAARAEQLFSELIESESDASTEVDARAWHARALAARGWADAAAAEIAAVRVQADDPDTTGSQFLAAIADHELAMRTGRYEDALAATEVELGYITLFLPAWENGVWYRRADALRALGRHDEALTAVRQSRDTTPPGADGRRWLLRTKVLERRIQFALDGRWHQREAEDLTDVLLSAGWYTAAVELLVARAVAQKDADLSSMGALLAMGLGDPTTAAAAIDAGGSWNDALDVAVAVQGLADRVSDESWKSLPGISDALAVSVDAEDAAPDWHSGLQDWLTESGFGTERVSPAQRNQRSLVRRTKEPRRWATSVLAAGVAAATAVVVLIALGAFDRTPDTTMPAPEATEQTNETPAESEPTTTTSLWPWEIKCEAPETLAGSFAYLGGNTRSGIVDDAGLADASCYFEQMSTADPISSAPAVLGSNVYVGGEDGSLHILDMVTGDQTSLPMSGEVTAPIVTAEVALGGVQSDNKTLFIYVADRRGRVVAFNRDTTEFERLELGTDITAAPLVTEHGVVIQTVEGRLFSMNFDLTGVPQWEMTFPNEEVAPRFSVTAVEKDGLMYAASDDGRVFAIDVETGAHQCTYDAQTTITAGPAIAEDRVFIPAGRSVRVLEFGECDAPVEGVVQVQLGNVTARTTPVVVGDTMFIASNRLFIALELDPEPGTTGELWSYDTGAAIASSPIYSDGVFYFGSNDGYVYAVRDHGDSKEELWKYNTGARVQTSVAVIDGAVVATNAAGDIIVIGNG